MNVETLALSYPSPPQQLPPRPPPPRALASAHWRTTALALVAGITAFATLSRGPTRSPESVARVRELQPMPPPAPSSPLSHAIGPIDFNAVPLENALAQLATLGDVNIVPQWATMKSYGAGRYRTVTLRMARATLRQALTATMISANDGQPVDAARLDWIERDGVIVVSTLNDFAKTDSVTRVYDVRDLLQNAALVHDEIDQIARQQIPNASQTSVVTPAELEQDRVDQLMKLIIDDISPTTWLENGGEIGRCQYWGGQLVVTQTQRTQQDVEAFLELLRRRD